MKLFDKAIETLQVALMTFAICFIAAMFCMPIIVYVASILSATNLFVVDFWHSLRTMCIYVSCIGAMFSILYSVLRLCDKNTLEK